MIQNSSLEMSPLLPQAALGEGVFLGPGYVAWLDILASSLQCYRHGEVRVFPLPVQASVILTGDRRRVLVLSREGVGELRLSSGGYSLLTGFGGLIPPCERTNDGCLLSDGTILFGTMSLKDPSRHPGSIFRCLHEGNLVKIMEGMHIPNTFVETSGGAVLISDSYKGIVFLVNPEEPDLTNVWYRAPPGQSPDGGCLMGPDLVAIAIWDGACVRLFDFSGQVKADLALPVPRPTSVAFDLKSQILWVTSAAEGLDVKLLKEHPLSGATFSVSNFVF